MKKLLPTRKKKSVFQQTVRYSFFRHFSETASTPKVWVVPSIHIPLLAMGASGLLLIGLALYFFVVDRHPIAKFVNTLLFWAAIGSTVLAGDNHRRLLHWMGLWSLTLRKRGVPADQSPISRRFTRVVFYALTAFDISLLIFWLIYTRVSFPDPALFTDLLLYEEAKTTRLIVQLGSYWWLLPLLVPLLMSALKGAEEIPVLRFVLRQTRLLIPLAPLALGFEVRMILSWITAVTGWSPF